jgi:phosphoserine phosphatase
MSAPCRLKAPGWNYQARRSLEKLIERGAGQGLPVVFDFDNTLISGDVGEATLAILAAEGRLTPANLSKTLCPVLQIPGKEKIAVEQCSDIMEYYEALLSPTAHGSDDPAPLANGYVWATQAMEGMTVAEVVSATARVFALGQRGGHLQIEVTPGNTSYPAPRFREEMVELIAQLLLRKYEVWIVSASNVWSVRWMVLYGLNPLLRKQGVPKVLAPKHVIGVATLLTDRLERLYKDSVLLRKDSAYAAMHRKPLKAMYLTRHLQFPASVYSGKVACILDAIGRNPYLCAGDNPSDHPMMRISEHRLWIARLEKPKAQRATSALIKQMGKAGWILQICSETDGPRFLTSLDGAPHPKNMDTESRQSAAILRRLGRQLLKRHLNHG